MISRRRLLQYGAAAWGSSLLPSCSTFARRHPASTDAKQAPVAVIGAGAAGIACARRLTELGFSRVTLLEARPRIGGRVHAVTAGDGTTFELGAGWVHGDQRNSIYDTARAWGLPLVPSGSNGDTQIWDAKGRRISDRRSQARYHQFLRLLNEIRENSAEGVSVAEAFRQQILPRLDREESRWMSHFLRSNLVETEGAELEEIAAAENPLEGGAEGADYILADGYSGFLKRAAEGLPILTSSHVRQISTTPTGVQLERTSPQGTVKEHYSAVVITVPLGVLRTDQDLFAMKLPAWKTQAMEKIGYGHFCKLFLRFPSSFWPHHSRWLESMGRDDRFTQFFPISDFTGSKTLITIAGGRQARRWQETDDQLLAARAVAQLRRQFGREVPDAVEQVKSHWSADPYSAGAYSFRSVTTAVTDFENLARPVDDRLYFAGEATHTLDQGTVHGAWDSGLRAATEIARRFS